MAYEQVNSTYRVTFQNNVELALQMKTNPYEKYFTFQSGLKGKEAQVVEYVGPVEPIIDGARGGDTPNQSFTHETVFCKPRQLEGGTTLEKEDAIKRTIDLQGVYVQGIAKSIVRGRRKLMRDALLGPRLVGDANGDSRSVTAYAAGANNTVAKDFVRSGAAAVSGLTFDKIIKARTLLVGSEVDPSEEMLAMAISQFQEFDLYGQVQFLSTEYRNRAVIDESQKRVISFLGIDFIRDEGLPYAEAGVRSCPLWCVSAMHYGDFSPLETNLDRDPGKKYRLRPYAENWFGATRSEDRMVINVKCAEA